MPRSTPPERTLDELLADLEAAVASGDTALAEEIRSSIERRLATEAADRAAVERRVRELTSELTLEMTEWRDIKRGPVALDIPLTRGGDAESDGDRIYPVWFGTNRRPAAGGAGFTSERHDQITHGRVNV